MTEPADLIAHAIALENYLAHDRKSDGPRTQALRACDPTLDLSGLDAVIDALFALDPTSHGRQCYPITFALTDANRDAATKLAGELRVHLERLKSAGARLTAQEPSRRDAYVLCTIDRYVETIEPNPSDPERYTSMVIQDMGYQVDGFYEDVKSVGLAENLESICAFGNEMQVLGFDASKLKKLRAIDLSQNLLSEIPPSLVECGALEFLNLNENPIEYFPADIGRLRSLRYLGVSGTRLRSDQIEALRVALPECVVDHERRIYTQDEKLMNFVLNGKTWIVRADGVVEVPQGPLPRSNGRHLVPAKADLDTGSDIDVVAALDATTGAVRLWWRDAGEWIDVTSRATSSTLLYSLAPA